MNGKDFRDYMEWVGQGTVFFVRPQKELLREDGVRASVTWDSVIRIDGMIKMLLEQYGIRYLPIDMANMQERCRAVEFVLERMEGIEKKKNQAPAKLLPLVGS